VEQCYLIVKEATNRFAWFRNPGELRVADLETGRSEPVVRGFEVHDYDISADSKQLVMWIVDTERKSRLWLAQLDRSSPPVEIPNVEGVQPGSAREAKSSFAMENPCIAFTRMARDSARPLRNLSISFGAFPRMRNGS
jgi:hypothetical protein